MSKFLIFSITAFFVAVCIIVISNYYFISSSADADWYIKIAKGDIKEVIKPFSGRVLHPLTVRLFSFLSGFDINVSFWALNVFLLFGFVIMLSLFFSKISFMNAALVFTLLFSPVLLNYFRYFYLTELFYSFLLILFFYFLKNWNFAWSLPLLFLLFLSRPIQALILGCALVAVSFYKSEKKFSFIALAVVLLVTLVSFQISNLGQPNAHNLGDFRYYVLQPIYYFVRSVLGIDWVANTHLLQYCEPRFSFSVPNWISLGDIKSIGICQFNINRPLQTFLYPLIAFGFIPLMLFFVMYKNRRRIWEENQIWLLTALVYGISILFIATIVPGLRTVGYGWPAFWLASLFIFDKQIQQWPVKVKENSIKFFIFMQSALLWLPYLIVVNFSFTSETFKYFFAFCVIFIFYFLFIKMYLITARKYNIV